MGKYAREIMKQSPLSILLVTALTLGTSLPAWSLESQSRFYDRKEEGWFWYKEDPPEPEKKPKKPEPKPVASAKPVQAPPTSPSRNPRARNVLGQMVP